MNRNSSDSRPPCTRERTVASPLRRARPHASQSKAIGRLCPADPVRAQTRVQAIQIDQGESEGTCGVINKVASTAASAAVKPGTTTVDRAGSHPRRRCRARRDEGEEITEDSNLAVMDDRPRPHRRRRRHDAHPVPSPSSPSRAPFRSPVSNQPPASRVLPERSRTAWIVSWPLATRRLPDTVTRPSDEATAPWHRHHGRFPGYRRVLRRAVVAPPQELRQNRHEEGHLTCASTDSLDREPVDHVARPIFCGF